MRPSGQCSYEIVSFPLKVNEKNVTLLDGTGACWDEASCWVPASGTRRPSTLQWLMWIMNCNYVFGYNSNLIYHFSIILGILTSCCFLYINNLSRNLLKCKLLIFKRNDEFYGLLWIYWHLNLELIVIRFLLDVLQWLWLIPLTIFELCTPSWYVILASNISGWSCNRDRTGATIPTTR